MSKHLLNSTEEVAVWLRRLRGAVIGYVGLILLVGVVYLVAKLIGAEFGTLLIGVVATLAGLALGAVAWGGLWLVGVASEQAVQIERQRERITLLESHLQVIEVELEQLREAQASTAQSPDPAVPPQPFPRIVPPEEETAQAPEAPAQPALAAPTPERAQSDEDRFRAALESGDLRRARELWKTLNGTVSAEQRTRLAERLDALTARVAEELRNQFVAMIQAEQFSAALRTGEEIVRVLPDSRMRRDFEAIRPHLEARAAARTGSA